VENCQLQDSRQRHGGGRLGNYSEKTGLPGASEDLLTKVGFTPAKVLAAAKEQIANSNGTVEAQGDCDVMALYERLAIEDIQHAADALRPVYEATEGRDGYVSLEVSPYLAMSTDATVVEARRLWRAVGRDNLMIKVPATEPGLPAIRQLIGEGINVNITLLFSQQLYEDVVEAYLAGLERLVAQGGDPSKIASVASFFVSRIDVAVDRLIEKRLLQTTCTLQSD
jgi:transaldolase/glucose-6-phosphate isomerase